MLSTVSNNKNPVIHVDPGIVPLAPQILHGEECRIQETWILCSQDCFHTDCKIWYSSQLLHILQIALPWLCWRMLAAARYGVTACGFDYTSQCILLTGWLLQAFGVYCILLGVEQWLVWFILPNACCWLWAGYSVDLAYITRHTFLGVGSDSSALALYCLMFAVAHLTILESLIWFFCTQWHLCLAKLSDFFTDWFGSVSPLLLEYLCSGSFWNC